MKKQLIGIIGLGNMGSAMAERMGKVLGFDKDAAKAGTVKTADIAKDIKDLTGRAGTVILAVKPQDIAGVLSEVKNAKQPDLIISVAAGITTGYIEKILGDARVVRAMPNLPAKIGRGMTGLCAGRFAEKGDLYRSQKLFRALGQVLITEEEKMNAVTAVSGSGPAYVCYFLQKGLEKSRFLREFRDAAEKTGFNKRDATLLVDTTFSGTMAFLKKTGISPSDLVKQVASKGGTTEAALAVLNSGGSLEEAIFTAKKRAEELCL